MRNQGIAQVASSGNSLQLPKQCQQMFKQLNFPAISANELVSGVKLAKLVNRVLYDDKNAVLSNQIITQNEQRKGNNVINMNMILKQVRSNPKVKCPTQIQQLTTFKLIDSQQEMIKFVNWIMSCRSSSYKNQNQAKQSIIEDSKENIERNTGNYIRYDDQYRVRNRNNNSHRQALMPYHHALENDHQYENQVEANEQSNEQKEDNLFQNVFFCDRDLSPQKEKQQSDSLQLSQKAMKKGSFKIFKPKTIFSDSQNEQQRTNQMKDLDSPQKNKKLQANIKNNKNGTIELNHRYHSDEKQSSDRKTIPKMPQRPPIYRKLNKQHTKTQSVSKNTTQQIYKQPAPFLMESQQYQAPSTLQVSISKQDKQIKRAIQLRQNDKNMDKTVQLMQQINNLEQQIKKQRTFSLKQSKNHSKSQSNHMNSIGSLDNSGSRRSNRKIFKLDIKEVNEAQRKGIVEWLISINLLNSMATHYYDRFHQICKNGVIFPEIINHHKGRTAELCYFKNPVKSAEIHSNYQKVFSYLKQLPNFESELLFMYDYFVPETLENAFWSLLKSCQQTFQKYTSKNKVYTRQSSIKERMISKNQNSSHSKLRLQSNGPKNSISNKKQIQNQYQKIRYGSAKRVRQSIVAKAVESKIIATQPIYTERQQPKRKSSLQFIKDLPDKQSVKFKPEQLVQAEEPVQLNKANKGYRQLHEFKKSQQNSSFINTPKKKNESFSGSRIISSNSIKKVEEKPSPPSITLQMQMKSLKYIKEKGYLNFINMGSIPLFEDIIRNGVLFNKLIIQQLKVNHKYCLKPRNIVDCRQNFKKGFQQLKQAFVLLPNSYEYYFQDIIKGQINLFYGLVWHVISASVTKGAIFVGQNMLKNQSAILNLSKNYQNQQNEKTLQQILFWFRELQQQNSQIAEMQIRDINGLIANLLNNNLLYKISSTILSQKYTIKPTYDRPINPLEQESNIKKILSFMSHNKILRSDLVWKTKSILKKQKNTTIQILKQLMNYYKNTKKQIINIETENPVMSFVKFARNNSREQLKNNLRANQRLETTMANNSFAGPARKQSQNKSQNGANKQIQTIEVPWMRSLGFSQNLSLNNGVILCRLMSKLTMQSINVNENPTSKAECLTNIRKALKLTDKFKWDQQDIVSADEKTTVQIYKYIRQKYKHSYALKTLC